jgi:threonine dehydratase
VRGALNALLAARERGDTRTVIAASAGNHAQGLAGPVIGCACR